MTESSTPMLDSYPRNKVLFLALFLHASIDPINMHLLDICIDEIVNLTGDDELEYELREMYEQSQII